ncbi:MAG: TolC family protein [Cyclobacteriaceae bacterium]|nr:TolC family protein [Cyclobacteriaceae bacterium]
MKRMINLLLFLLMVSSAFGQITIEHCQEKAKANYPLIRQYDLIAQSAEYTISNANKAYLPQLSLNGIGAYIIKGFPAVSLPGMPAAEEEKLKFIGIAQLNQTIWDGGATRTQKNVASANAAVENANIDVALHHIEERVNQLFFGILVIDEQLKQLTIVNENLTRNLNKLQLTKDNGLAFQTDVDELKAEILNLEQRKIDFTFTRKGYVDMLSYLMGEQLPQSVQLQKPIVENIENIITQQNNRPELTLYSSQRALIEQKSSFNKVLNMPKIGLMGAGILVSPEANFGASQISSLALAGLSVSWNTGGIYTTTNNRQLDRIQLDRIANQQETFLFTSNIQLKQIASEIEKHRAIVSKDDEIVALKASIKKSYQLKYDNGMSTMNDLITAINRESEARSNQALHQVQLLMSVYNYKTISGN